MSDSSRANEFSRLSSDEDGEGRALGPEDIESRQFPLAVRGYDVDEVQAFLAEAAQSYRLALDELESLRHLGQENPYEAVGDEVAAVLSSVKEVANQVRSKAEGEAQALRDTAREEVERAVQMREEAEREAEALVQAARQEAEVSEENIRRTRAELDRLQDQLREERESVHRAVEQYARMLGELRRDMADGQLGARALLSDLVIRLEKLEAMEDDLVARLEGADELLGTLRSEQVDADSVS